MIEKIASKKLNTRHSRVKNQTKQLYLPENGSEGSGQDFNHHTRHLV